MLKRLWLKAIAALLGVSLGIGSAVAYPPPVKPAKPIKPMPAKPIKPMPAKPIKPMPKPSFPKPGMPKPGFPKPLPPSVKKFAVYKHHRGVFTHHRLHPRFGVQVFWHPVYRCWFYWSPVCMCYLPVQYITAYPPAEVVPPVDPTGPVEPPDPDQ